SKSSSMRSETTGQSSGSSTSLRSERGGSRTTIHGRSQARFGVRGHGNDSVTIHRRHTVGVAEPSSRTVIKKKFKNPKFVSKKRARFVSSEPASRSVIIKKKRHPGVLVSGERSSRTVVHSRSRGPNVSVSSERGSRTTTGASS